MFALQPGYEKLKSLHSAKKFQPATVKRDGANPKILATGTRLLWRVTNLDFDGRFYYLYKYRTVSNFDTIV